MIADLENMMNGYEPVLPAHADCLVRRFEVQSGSLWRELVSDCRRPGCLVVADPRDGLDGLAVSDAEPRGHHSICGAAPPGCRLR
jgi:hypothetical protein